MEAKKALKNFSFWVGLAVLFNIGIFIFMGKKSALEFLGGYVIEQSLSLDNLFLFLLIFEGFALKPKHQKRVLNYGIIGAIILRLIFIVLGIAIVNMFHWILYIFGLVLIISGIKMFFGKEETQDYNDSIFFRALKKILPVTSNLEGEKFFVRRNKILHATPLFAILVIVEGSDILFAIDSIPAIFSITTNTFIVYTSNIFAILGLRALYFLLQKLHNKFAYVKYGVALILTFTGIKLGILLFHMEIGLITSLLVIFFILIASIIFSVLKSKKNI